MFDVYVEGKLIKEMTTANDAIAIAAEYDYHNVIIKDYWGKVVRDYH